jgi:hypothetical protein
MQGSRQVGDVPDGDDRAPLAQGAGELGLVIIHVLAEPP